MDRDFDGKVAIVTGGGAGIGRASAVLLASRGAHVVIGDLHQETAPRQWSQRSRPREDRRSQSWVISVTRAS